jgi:hypothetical protein
MLENRMLKRIFDQKGLNKRRLKKLHTGELKKLQTLSHTMNMITSRNTR